MVNSDISSSCRQSAVVLEMRQRVGCFKHFTLVRDETSLGKAPEVGHRSGQVEAVIDVPVGGHDLRNACQFDGWPL
ncbi:hypothetical protein TNCV_2454531 [Trichonephila clavipes]|nr:hypothetical protein TNCV_2454531 [Trichonephila clavipes]